MTKLNPYLYDQLDYYQYEVDVAEKTLDLILAGSYSKLANIKDYNDDAKIILLDISSVIIYNKELLDSAVFNLNKFKEREAQKNG